MVKTITRAEALAQGLKTYFTGKPCGRGHVSARRAVNWTCEECNRAAQKLAHKLNPVPRRLRSKVWHHSHKRQAAAFKKLWHAKNPTYRKEASAKSRAADPKRVAAYQKAYQKANKARIRKNAAAWIKANPISFLATQAKHRAKKLNACPAWADSAAIKIIYAEARKRGLTVDHIYPLQGRLVSGLHVHTNLQLLTRAENAAKGNRYTPG